MKRFWLILLSLGLIMAFSVSAFAVDVKFSGSYYAAGMFVNRTTLNDDSASNGPSTAFYFQRLRVQTEFVVTPGLNLITRFDAMERVWGATRSTPSTTAGNQSMGTAAENENIAIDYAYVKYDTPAGSFRVGAMPAGTWGTVFNDTSAPAWRLFYASPIYSGFQLLAIMQKMGDNSYTANNTTATQADKDQELYIAGFTYTAKTWTTGLAAYFFNYANTRTNTATDYKRKSYQLVPYVKAQIGPLAVQAEVDYAFGKIKEYDNAGNTDVKLDSLAYFLDAVATFGPVYVGGTFAYSRGENADTTDVQENSLTGGLDWSPTLIMWNEDRALWLGSLTSSAATTGFGTAGMSNAYFYQIRAGVKPIDKLNICASVSYATADTTPAGYVSKDYGYEIDVTGTYKITNNLSYMLGVGYLLTGDYFKGTDSSNKVANDYLVINKLTLTF